MKAAVIIFMTIMTLGLTLAPNAVRCETATDQEGVSSSWLPSWGRARDVFLERMGRNPMAFGNPMSLWFMSGLRSFNESGIGLPLSFVPVVGELMIAEELTNAIDPVSPSGPSVYKRALGGGIQSFAQNVGEWLADAVDVINQVLADLRSKVTALHTAGTSLLALFTFIAVAMLGLNWMLDGDIGDVIKGGFELVLVVGLALWFLNSYGTVFEKGLAGSFEALGDQMAKGLAPQGGAIVGAAAERSPLYHVGQTMALHMATIWDSGVSGNPNAWGASLASVLAIFAMLLALILFFIHYMYILVRLSIAHIVAPIFIACLPLKQTRFLFEGWLRYIIACGLSLMLLYLMVALGTAILAAIPEPSAQTSGTLDLSAAMLVMILAMVTVRMTKTAEQAANGILHGHPVAWAGATAAAWRATGGRMAQGVKSVAKGVQGKQTKGGSQS